MNERLRELMISAGYASPELAGRAQRLALLIVKECAKQADNYWDEFENNYAHRKILEHFGVD